MLKQPQPCDATSREARVTRRDLLSHGLAIGGASALTALWPRGSALAAATAAQNVSRYLVYVGGAGAVIDSLIDMQQVAAPPPQTTAATDARMKSAKLLPTTAVTTQMRIAMGWNPVKPFADWVEAAAAHVAKPQNGSLFVTDTNYNLRSAYNWFAGAISRIELPGCDAASPTPLSPILTIQAPQLTQAIASGQPPAGLHTPARGWQQRNFRLTSTAPIDSSLTRTLRVSAIALGPDIHGGTVDIAMHFGPERPDWLGPFQTALQHGGQLMAQPTDMTLHLLAPDLRTDLAAIGLHNCRVVAINILAPPAGVQNAAPTTVVTLAFAEGSLGITSV